MQKVANILLAAIILVAINAKGQESFNNTTEHGISANYSTYKGFYSCFLSYQYRFRKNCLFVGAGYVEEKKDSYQWIGYPFPEFYAGFRQYPGKNIRKTKFYYQSFLYYDFHHGNPETGCKPINLWLINVGIGVEYEYTKHLTLGLGSDVGIGRAQYGFASKFVPATFFITYKFKRNVKI